MRKRERLSLIGWGDAEARVAAPIAGGIKLLVELKQPYGMLKKGLVPESEYA